MKAKMIKRAVMVCAAAVYMLLMCFAMAGCGEPYEKHTEDFYYYRMTLRDKNNHPYKCIAIGELTDMGKTKEMIVIPTEIDGYPVEQLYNPKGWYSSGGTVFESDVLKKIYVPLGFYIEGTLCSCKNLEKVICYYNRDHYGYGYTFIKDEDASAKVYIKSLKFDVNSHKDGRYAKWDKWRMDVYFANVSYMYNFYDADNDGYYFVDDYDYGSKIEYIPDNPKRDGYTFGGWYKEEECVNKWDFDNDTLPDELTEENEDGETIVIYQETRLYAKWIKK